uniref:Ribosomal protein L5 n=1 Tax=Triantha glutinosa TaxID=207928 RepID=A0A1Z1R1I1_9LILI|nr:ribosomal protein L5 [Triantha glutinosa]
MLPLHFHYEDVLRQDLLLKANHANVLEVPGASSIRFVPKTESLSSLLIRRRVLLFSFLVRISTQLCLESPNFVMETEWFELSPELDKHFEIFENIIGFNVRIVTSAKTKDETLLLWSGLMQKSST